MLEFIGNVAHSIVTVMLIAWCWNLSDRVRDLEGGDS